MTSEKTGLSRVKRVLPWAGTVLLLAYLASTTDLKTVASSLAQVSIPAVLAVAFFGTLATFLTDSWCVSLAFSRFVCPVSYREALPIKATSYFLNVLNYNVALVGMAFYLQRSRQAPFWRALGAMFFLNLMDILALSVLLAIGLVINWGTDTLDPATKMVAWVLSAGGVGGFSFLVLVCKLELNVPLLHRVLKFELLKPLAQLDLLTVVKFVLLRLVFLLQYLFAQYLFLKLFQVDVPIVRLVVYLPLLTFVQIIPISVSGLGTVQLVMRQFYARYVARGVGQATGVIDAFSTSAIFGFLMFRIVVAYLFLGEFSREVIQRAGKSLEPEE